MFRDTKTQTRQQVDMKTPSAVLLLGLSLLLLGRTVSAVSLSVSPNRELFLRRDSVSLSCVDGGQTADGWTVKRTAGGQAQTCDAGQQDFGRIDGSSCVIPYLYPSDSGAYWCETSAGRRSVPVSINVSDHSVILEFPKTVITGSDVTLRCKTRNGSVQTGYLFFRNGSFVGAGLAGEFTITDVQQTDEGFYSCSTGLFFKSPKSWLSVRDPDSPLPPPPPPPPSLPAVRLLCHLVVVTPYFISTVLMLTICCSRRRGNTSAVSMEMDTRLEGGHGRAEQHDYVPEPDL